MESLSESLDGGFTITDPYVMTYGYNMAEALLSHDALKDLDKAGIRKAVSDWMNQPVIEGRVNGWTVGVLGGVTVASRDRLGAAPSEVQAGLTTSDAYAVHSVAVDAFGNSTESWSSQIYTVIGGQAKLASATMESLAETADGSETATSPYVMTYAYEPDSDANKASRRVGGLISLTVAAPTGTTPTGCSGATYAIYSWTTDAFGSVTESWSKQTYTIIAGQAKMTSMTTETQSWGVDGTHTATYPYTMWYSCAGQSDLSYDALKDMSAADVRDAVSKWEAKDDDGDGSPNGATAGRLLQASVLPADNTVICPAPSEDQSLASSGTYTSFTHSDDPFGAVLSPGAGRPTSSSTARRSSPP